MEMTEHQFLNWAKGLPEKVSDNLWIFHKAWMMQPHFWAMLYIKNILTSCLGSLLWQMTEQVSYRWERCSFGLVGLRHDLSSLVVR